MIKINFSLNKEERKRAKEFRKIKCDFEDPQSFQKAFNKHIEELEKEMAQK